jgi:hypothetical protein
MTIKTIFIGSLLALLSLGSCELFESEEEKAPYYVVKTDESKDINKLGKLINLENFRPEKVDFQHIYIETVNGNGSEEPKDDYLQAVLYFDAPTFQRLQDNLQKMSTALRKHNRSQFEFPWLDDSLRNQLKNSEGKYYNGYMGDLFGEKQAKLWLLDKKVLLYREIK